MHACMDDGCVHAWMHICMQLKFNIHHNSIRSRVYTIQDNNQQYRIYSHFYAQKIQASLNIPVPKMSQTDQYSINNKLAKLYI